MMQGLLGPMDDPQSAGLLSLGLRLMSTPGNFGSALGTAGLGAMGDMQQARQMQEQRKRQEQMMQMQQMQMEQAQRAQKQAEEERARQAAIEQAYRGAIRSPEQQAMGQFGGPTVAAAAAAPGMAPAIDQQALIRGLMKADPMSAYKMLQPTPADYKVVGDSLVSVGPQGVKEAYRAPPKPEAGTSDMRNFEYGQKNPAFNEWALSQKKAGASSVNVSTDSLGLKPKDRFEMEGKLASDYQGTVKLDNLVLGATSKMALHTIRTAVRTGSPIELRYWLRFIQGDALRHADERCVRVDSGRVRSLRLR